jgi:Flp pilus assembly protein TadB
MAVPISPAPQTDRILKQLERERREESEERATVWAFLWVLFAFKMATIGVIWYVAAGTGQSLVMIAATTWYWLVIPIAALAGPLLVRWRMIKMRRRREELRRAEWCEEPGTRAVHDPQFPALPGDRP